MQTTLLASLTIGLMCLSSCKNHNTIIYNDNHVVVRQLQNNGGPYNVHGGKINVLTAAGRDFEWVQGSPPYYLPIPELHSILFTTERDFDSDNTMIYIVNLDTRHVVTIPDPDFDFGNNIGSGRLPGAIWTDYIERVELPDKIVLAAVRPQQGPFFNANIRVQTTCVLNLRSSKIESITKTILLIKDD